MLQVALLPAPGTAASGAAPRATAELSAEQALAVEHAGGPLLVLAGPGTGKTRVIVQRIARLVRSGVSPRAITAISFTRRAAGELRERSRALFGTQGAAIEALTFHALGLGLLRAFADGAGLAADFPCWTSPRAPSCWARPRAQRASKRRSLLPPSAAPRPSCSPPRAAPSRELVPQRVALLTLHAAKGLEFPLVFIAGCEDGLLPLRCAGREPDDAEEERRLLYVGMTRAKSRLVLTRALQRHILGGAATRAPSPFLAGLPAELVQHSERAERRRAEQLRLL